MQSRINHAVRRMCLCAAAVACLFGGLVSLAPAGTTAPADASVVDSDGDGDLDTSLRADAAWAAAAHDERVEVLAERTETSRVFANPDGTWTDEIFSADVRTKTPGGSWQDVNYDLVETNDGNFAPTVATTDVQISGGGTKEAARLTLDDGESLAISWPATLPAPTVEGGVATYKLSPATDLIVATTGSGVSTMIRLNQPPAIDDPVYTLGLRTEDLDVDQVQAGGLKFTNDDGDVVGTSIQLEAWDAELDEGGDPANIVPVTADLIDVSTSGGVSKHALRLSVDDGFLSDPSTNYPVTIDPDLGTMRADKDTWVRSGTTTVNGNSYRLQVGRISDSDNNNETISFISFPQAPLTASNNAGRVIKRASIHLYSYLAGSCSPRNMAMARLIEPFSEVSTVFTNQPDATGAQSALLTQNRGKNNCPGSPNNPGNNGYVEGDITAMVDVWTRGAAANYGLRMKVPAANSTDPTYERRFCSSELSSADDICNYVGYTPYLIVTYNTRPVVGFGSVGVENLQPGEVDRLCGVTLGNTTELPRAVALVADADGHNVTPVIQWSTGNTVPTGSPELGASSGMPTVASGQTVRVPLPFAQESGTYSFRVRAVDAPPYQDSSLRYEPNTDVGGTPPCTFTIDRSLPGNPTVSDLPEYWEAGQSYSLTFTPGGDDASKTARYAFTWNDAVPPSSTEPADGPGYTRSQTVVAPDPGVYDLRVWAYNAAGNASAVPAKIRVEVG